MVKKMTKTKGMIEEAMEACVRRESDESEDEESEEGSETSFDSEAEALFQEGEEISLYKQSSDVDSDTDWEPDCPPVRKRPRREEQQDGTSPGDEPQHPAPQRGRGRGRGSSRSQARWSAGMSEETWNDVDIPDVAPPQPKFRPTRTPGPQLVPTASYTALQLFQRFFPVSVVSTITQNTNDYGSLHHSKPSDPWVDLTVQDMYSFMAMIVYMGLVKCSATTDYWRGGRLYSFPFPREVMSGKKFHRICRSLHLSSTVADVANDERRGTAAYDRLCKIKPLYLELREACNTSYHPHQEIAIDERMVASESRIGLKRHTENKTVRWRYKLFVLADSRNGFTWDFFVYDGTLQGNSGKGLGYESVMELADTRLLGAGYKLFVDKFYTSPNLLRDLLQRKIWACGTIRADTIGYPKTKVNGLTSKSPRGSVRWIREDSLLFVQWRDGRDAFFCSTLHAAHGAETATRRMQAADGRWEVKNIPVPPVVKEYNQCLAGVHLSENYKVLLKTRKWYKTFFYHFLDIAIVNAYLIHKELAKGKGEAPMHQKAFRETLAVELAEMGSPSTARHAPPPAPAGAHHKPAYISGSSTSGRLRCAHCHAKTPVKCTSCNVSLCFVPGRDCYNDWHFARNL